MNNQDNNHNYSLNEITVPLENFLHCFANINERICFRVFSDKPNSAFAGQKLECVLDGISDIEDELKRHNSDKRGVYFVVNQGGHEDSEITRVTAQFVEMDDTPLEEQLHREDSLGGGKS